ncbi:deSI-like protein At4g17486 isoform X2 [Salvia hispanica]|uniref:deSI-like protein At4g17486 isoform X2 n=1 Tax=Salvia hispanica TaxID=49212 RepID=UPI0020096F2F|nr:deSI-like protein At4g17486 isoform X2 [Salvia hispanica]
MRLFPFSSCLDESRAGKTDVEKNQVMLFLNVYDLTPANKYLYWFGLGFYHSGIEVHGLEYAFGATVEPTSGVFDVVPKHFPEMARIGSVIESVLPESAQTAPLRQLTESQSQTYSDRSDSDASYATDESETEDVDHHVLISAQGNVGLSDRPQLWQTKNHL